MRSSTLSRLRARLAADAGFTLVELLVVMLILGIVIGGITTSFVSGSVAEATVRSHQQTQADARAALTRMREDIHCAYYVESVSQNTTTGVPPEGFSLALTEFAGQCAAVDTTAGTASCGTGAGNSCVFLQWCTLPDPDLPGTFDLYRSNTTCGTTGELMASGIVAPPGGWPQNSTIAPSPTDWNGNLWPTSRPCLTSFLPTQAVDIAVNADSVRSPNQTYELKDEIALRNASRCTAASVVTLTAPANGSSVNAATVTLSGGAGAASGDSNTVTVTIHSGAGTGGAVVQTISVTRTGDTWSATAGSLPEGVYTAQATQTNSAGTTGVSNANTFTVDLDRADGHLDRPGERPFVEQPDADDLGHVLDR